MLLSSPPAEPDIFYGEPLEYPDWISLFTTLIEAKKPHPRRKSITLSDILGDQLVKS